MNKPKRPLEIGKFYAADWIAKVNRGCMGDFAEVPGYEAWNDFFTDARPPFVPQSEEEHMEWCKQYYQWACEKSEVPGTGHPLTAAVEKPVMLWKNKPIPTYLYVLEVLPLKRVTIDSSPNYTPFYVHDRSLPASEQDLDVDVHGFYSIVFMHLAAWQPVPYELMKKAASKLRLLCRRPLFKLFNISFSKSMPITLESSYLSKTLDPVDEKTIKETILWHKLMVDMVVHHDIRLKIEKTKAELDLEREEAEKLERQKNCQ
ncbi:unnamed protein product [Caenorhabditis brenneri]